MESIIEEKIIIECEEQLGARFPETYRKSMMNQNGGVVEIDDLEWNLVPIADIASETNDDATWNGYPNRAVSIGRDMFGDILVLLRLGRVLAIGCITGITMTGKSIVRQKIFQS